MKDDIFEKVAEIILLNNKNLTRDDIKPAATFEELNMDSLDGISLITDLENHYKIILTNEEVSAIKNVGDAVSAIEVRLN